jgi:tagatose-6-phosphate ketose/aldose isomerase
VGEVRRPVYDWTEQLAKKFPIRHHQHMPLNSSETQQLLAPSEAEQIARGYCHTLREILQQPATWLGTWQSHELQAVIQQALAASGVVANRGAIVFTGSGSSQYVGDCLAMPLQGELDIPVFSIPSGLLLTHPRESLPPIEPLLLVSIARSGNSPESLAVQQLVTQHAPRAHHLVLTCNAQGKLASAHPGNPQVHVAVLDERTNDRSLVMTSSFTNLALAGRLLSATSDSNGRQAVGETVAQAARGILENHCDDIASAARLPFRSAIYLGSGCQVGAAREAALKLLEMNAGRIPTMSESFLGFRHGPMSATGGDTLLIALLSSDPTVRAYELELLAEVEQKELGLHTIVAGSNLPPAMLQRKKTTAINFELPSTIRDGDLTVLHVVVGQLLAFFRCLHEGLRPDSPSESGVISRVVAPFRIHTPRACSI